MKISSKLGKHHPGAIPLYSETTVTALRGEIEKLERHIELLQNKINGPRECACAYDHPNDICLHHSPQLVASQADVERLTEALRPFAKVADILMFSGATTANEIELSGEQLFGALMAARAAITRQGETG